MENQHRQILGYRELGEGEIAAMNQIKETAAAVGLLVESLRASDKPDQRWVNIGATELQQGFMALIRAVARPTSF